MEKIIIASDHAGFELKNKLFEYLKNKGFVSECVYVLIKLKE